jgi:hypothetical protein
MAGGVTMEDLNAMQVNMLRREVTAEPAVLAWNGRSPVQDRTDGTDVTSLGTPGFEKN